MKTQTKGDVSILEAIQKAQWIIDQLPIRYFGDSILYSPCKAITQKEFGTKKLKASATKLIKTLKAYRKETGTGRGLAANQIGIGKRMICIWLGDDPEVFCNPQVISTTGKGSYWESCLSSGSLLIGQVIRPWQGKFKYWDLEGKVHTLDANEKQTRLFLHEMQHLDGGVCTELYEPGTIRFIRGGKEEVLGYKFERIN